LQIFLMKAGGIFDLVGRAIQPSPHDRQRWIRRDLRRSEIARRVLKVRDFAYVTSTRHLISVRVSGSASSA